MALKALKEAQWYQDLSTEDQKDILKSTKQYYSPPDKMQNTLMNIYLDLKRPEYRRLHEEYNIPIEQETTDYLTALAKEFPKKYPDGVATENVISSAEERLFKAQYVNDRISENA